MQLFTPEKPPKTGKAKELWDWWIEHKGVPPDLLGVNRPGRHQRSAGTCHYWIQPRFYVNNTYLVSDVDQTLKLSPDDAVPAGPSLAGHYYLE